MENVGFVVYFTRHQSRFSTYSMQNEADSEDDQQGRDAAGSEYFAFKVLPREFSVGLDEMDSDAGPSETCREVADRLVERIGEECGKHGEAPEVVEEEIVR